MTRIRATFTFISICLCLQLGKAQEIIPMDTTNFQVFGTHIFENYRGKNAIYSQAGGISFKNTMLTNGTIEFDIFLKEEHAFPGLMFRYVGRDNEQFFLRPHLSGKPDANQALPEVKGVAPFQLYFGPRYSFAYDYKFDDWTHVKVVINGDKAQVFLDHSETPHLSWNLTLPVREGAIAIRGGGTSGMHIADVIVNKDEYDLVDFKPIEKEPIEGIINEWEVSDKFEETLLDDPTKLKSVIKNRKWERSIQVEEGTAANLSRVQLLYDGQAGRTVFAKITINSSKNQIKLFNFGYSDRVTAILNGKAIYRGNNKWRSRDYRYLGTIGLFDGVYLDLKKGENTLLMAVSEDFGGWLITGKFEDPSGVSIK